MMPLYCNSAKWRLAKWRLENDYKFPIDIIAKWLTYSDFG